VPDACLVAVVGAERDLQKIMSSMKERLEADLRDALETQEQLAQRLAQKPDVGLGGDSTGTVAWEMVLARKERLAAEIEELKVAIERIEQGVYGQCDQCGARIDPERLEALPTTTLCANCA
jgi:RNA polymerase-binding transcription factor DksA